MHQSQGHNLYTPVFVSALLHHRHPGSDSSLTTDTSNNDLKNIFLLVKQQLNKRAHWTIIASKTCEWILLV